MPTKSSIVMSPRVGMAVAVRNAYDYDRPAIEFYTNFVDALESDKLTHEVYGELTDFYFFNDSKEALVVGSNHHDLVLTIKGSDVSRILSGDYRQQLKELFTNADSPINRQEASCDVLGELNSHSSEYLAYMVVKYIDRHASRLLDIYRETNH